VPRIHLIVKPQPVRMKKPLLLLSSLFCCALLYAQPMGPNTGSASNNTALASSSRSWTTTANTYSSDNTYASFGNLSNTVGSFTDYLVVTGFNFNVPAGLSVLGISIEIERSDVNGNTADHSIRIVKDGNIETAERSTGIAYPATDAYQSYGGSTDLWGQTWNYKELNDPGFGVAIAAKRINTGGQTQGRVDHVRITLYFQAFITLPVQLTAFNANKSTGNNVLVRWSTADESAIDHYEIERSTNGRDYRAIGSVMSRNSSSATSYSFNDNQSVKGTSWYRLKIIEQTGSTKNSGIALIRIDDKNTHVLFPTLVRNGEFLSVSNPGIEPLTIRFYSVTGELSGKTTTNTGQVKVNAAAGMLRYTIVDDKGKLAGAGSVIVE
jgi:hypothetical protein